jgi:hypothetical protein
MSEPVLHETDIEDAETWIAKAALLGAVIKQHQTNIDTHAWRYSAIVPGKQIAVGQCLADWPGRVAKDIVERIQKDEEDKRNACM